MGSAQLANHMFLPTNEMFVTVSYNRHVEYGCSPIFQPVTLSKISVVQ